MTGSECLILWTWSPPTCQLLVTLVIFHLGITTQLWAGEYGLLILVWGDESGWRMIIEWNQS
jgi:hypothetical protein